MSLSLIVPMAADKAEYDKSFPKIFNFSDDGTLFCIKSILGLDISRFDHIYFTILEKHDKQFSLSELLNMQFKNANIYNAEVVVLQSQTNNEPETVYETIKKSHIDGGIFVKDADSYFTCDITFNNGITIFPLDKLSLVNPMNKSYVSIDDQFYITNIIEKKIISRYFNAGGYMFESAKQFCSYYEKLEYSNIYMSHIVFAMLLDNNIFRPFFADNYVDWG